MTMERRWALIGHIHNGVFAVDNVGEGAEIFRDTTVVDDVDTAHLRSLISSDGSVVITQNADEIDFATACGCWEGGSPLPGTTYVGAKKLACGDTVSFTPSSDVPTAAAGDLAIWIVQPRHGLLTDYNDALVKPPSGWSVYVPAPHSPVSGVTYETSMPAVFYKILEVGDINTTHTCTESSSAINYLCSGVLVYRNVNPAKPFAACLNNYVETFSQTTNVGLPLPVYSTAQHVVDIWNRAPSGVTANGDDFPYDESATYWPRYDTSAMEGFTELKFGVAGTGGDTKARQNSVATWAASILNDENLVPYENEAQSVTMGTWVGNEVTVTRTAGDWYTLITPSSENAEHYVEYEYDFVAGDKITFAAFVFAFTSSSHGYWITVIDPDGNERGRLWYHNSGNPGWFDGVLDDDLSDYGTVWRAIPWKNSADAVPEIPLSAASILMNAPSTGTYKFRIYAQSTNTNTVAARTDVGSSAGRIGVYHVLLRRGHVTPYVVPTGASPVIGSGASYSTPTRGWANTPHDSRHFAFALNPAYTDNKTPYARMRGLNTAFGPIEVPQTDGTTLTRYYNSFTDAKCTWIADQPIMPVIDGSAMKYYYEVEIVSGASEIFFFGVTNGHTRLPNSDVDNDFVAYGAAQRTTGTITWSDAAGFTTTSAVTVSNGDVFGCEVDFSANTVTFYKNGSLLHTTTILTQFPTTGGANFECANSPVCPLYLVAGWYGDLGTMKVRLRPEWIYGPSTEDFVPYDYFGDENLSTWVHTIPASGSGAQIVYQDPADGTTKQRSITGGEGIEVIQYDETVDVGLKFFELDTQAPVEGEDYIAFYDASTGGHSKALLSTLAGADGADGADGVGVPAGGTAGQVLAKIDGTDYNTEWTTPSGGSGDVATDAIWDAKGDLAVGTGADTASRLPVGSNGQVLTADSAESTGVKWATPGSGSSPTTTAGDMIVRGASADERLAIGTEGQVLSVVGGVPAWADAAAGGGGFSGAMVSRTGSAQTITTGTDTAVQFDTEDFDSDSYANLATHNTRLAAPATGKYLVIAHVRWDVNTSGGRNLWLRKNGTTEVLGSYTYALPAAASDCMQRTAVVVSLSAGDYVEAMVRQGSGSDRTIVITDTKSCAGFWMTRLDSAGSGEGGGGAGSSGAYLRRTASQSLTTGGTEYAISWDTEDRDDSGYWASSPNPTRLTASTSGWYHISTSVGLSAGSETYYLRIAKNGASLVNSDPIARMNAPTGVAPWLSLSATIYLTAGDYVEVKASSSGGGDTISGAFVSIHQASGTVPEVARDPTSYAIWETDFNREYLTTTGLIWDVLTGSSGTVAEIDSIAEHPGIIRCNVTTSSTSLAWLGLSSDASSASAGRRFFPPAGGRKLTVKALVRVSALPTGTCAFRVGLADNTSYGQRAMFNYNGTALYGNSGGSGGNEQTAASSGMTAGTWHWLKIVLDSSVPEVRFYIDDVLVATNSTAAYFPDGGFSFFIMTQNLGNTTSWYADIDYASVVAEVSR